MKLGTFAIGGKTSGRVFARTTVLFAVLVFVVFGVSFFYPRAEEQFAFVAGMSAGVESNEINRLAQEFSERERELSEREQAIREEEERLRLMFQEELVRERLRTLFFAGAMTAVLLILIGVNYYLDYTRRKQISGNTEHSTLDFQTRL